MLPLLITAFPRSIFQNAVILSSPLPGMLQLRLPKPLLRTSLNCSPVDSSVESRLPRNNSTRFRSRSTSRHSFHADLFHLNLTSKNTGNGTFHQVFGTFRDISKIYIQTLPGRWWRNQSRSPSNPISTKNSGGPFPFRSKLRAFDSSSLPETPQPMRPLASIRKRSEFGSEPMRRRDVQRNETGVSCPVG